MRRPTDVADVDDAKILSGAQWGVLLSFPFFYRWLVGEDRISRTKAGRMIGNAVAPAVMAVVGGWLLDAGWSQGDWDASGLLDPEIAHATTSWEGAAHAPMRVAMAQKAAIDMILVTQRCRAMAMAGVAPWARAMLTQATMTVVGSRSGRTGRWISPECSSRHY